ncbi:hypothetical protein O3G_MSEX008074 [Manduca sexta]|uniref:Carboxylic ester hydrolase n=1 Tax=Manduca sexta TaxID=7130 RepID=A0A921ZAL9_MANSE|nr:hypothetical protein O3G_MSEX008074 [Manduca sexta]KAG6453273.1 hypothetical protein O3G_MSEX008074 [Manduca sexta]UXP71953.1 esterase [Manduca sexta]
MWRWTFVLYVSMTASAHVSRVVQLPQGPVRGYRDPGGDIFTFYGIPYAAAPTGVNKFKAPLPPPTWQETLEAIDKGIICPQADFAPIVPKEKLMQEDCLIANIFQPDTKKNNLPVFIIIHGGGFQIGYGNWLTGENLMRTKDMIVVTFNYRLGKHGFLCLGTKDIPGNAGMKDQVALLRWVKHNIAAFGGNPSDVTVGGYSSGGASTDLLVLSKSSRGLFHKAIPESGYGIGAFSVQPNPLKIAKTFAKRLNFTNTDDIYALENFYKSASLELLMMDAVVTEVDNSYFFSPCVENDVDDESFLIEDPISIIKSGSYEKVPMLVGFSNMEGLNRIDLFEKWKNGMNENFANYLPPDLIFKDKREKEEVAKVIKQFYFNDRPVSNDNILSYINYFSDIFFTTPILLSIKMHLENGHDQIYLYEYSFADKNVALIPHTNVRGAEHCAQSMAVFDGTGLIQPDESNITLEYKEVKRTMRELWSNFITTGKPVSEGSPFPSWPAVRANFTPYMSLGQTLELKSALLERRVRFWSDIYDKYYHTPVPPPKLRISYDEL